MAKKTISNTFTVNTVEDGEDSVVYKIDFGNSVFFYDPNTNRNTIFINGTVYKVVGNDTLVFTELTSSMLSLAFYDANGALVRNVNSADVGVENGTFITRSGNASTPSSPNAEESLLATITINGVQVARNGLQIFKDGKSAPFYNEEWYAWSNVATTSDVNTSPFGNQTEPNSAWKEHIPAQGNLAYLWKKIVRWNYNASTKAYIDSSPQYFRMSGTDGTSIHTEGSVDYQTSQQATQHGGGTSLDDITNPSDGDAYVVGLDLEENEGWLYQWTTESGSWIPLGQFKGESGKTYYTHIVWATNVISSSMGITSIEGYVAAKDPDDTTHFWMGTYVDETPTDPTSGTDDILKQYSWTNTKGEAKLYSIQANKESAKIARNQTSLNTSVSFSFYTKTGDATREDFDTYFTIYTVANNGVHQRVNPVSSTPVRGTSVNQNFNLTTGIRSIAIFIWGTNLSSAYVGSYPNTQPYLAKKEIPVLKDGDDGQAGERGALGRSYYYAGVFDDSDTEKHYVVNDAQVPFFMHLESGQKRYHVFNPETSPQSGEMTMAQMWSESGSSWSNLPWEVMSNDFKYLISEAVFADFARFASFVMMGSFMFSLQGRWINDRHKDGATLIEYQLFSSNGGNTPIQATAYSFINTEETGVDRIAEFENMSEAGTSVDYKYIVKNSIHFVKGTMYSLTWESVSGCRIHLIDSEGNVYGLNSITKDQCFQVNDTGDYYVLAERTSLNGMTYTNVSLYQRYFSPNVCINGTTGDASMNNFKGSASLTQLVVRKGEYEDSGVANLGGVTYIKQPIFDPDYDAGSQPTDVPRLDTLPQIPLAKYVEVVTKDSNGVVHPYSAGKLVIDPSTNYLKYIPILTNP